MNHVIELKKSPCLIALYIEAIFKNKNLTYEYSAISPLKLTVFAKTSQLKKYQKLLKINNDSQILPIFYLQVLAFKLHLKLLNHKHLPFKVTGAIHKENSVTYHKPIYKNDPINFQVSIDKFVKTNTSTQCTILTEAYVSGEIKWQARSTYYHRNSKSEERKKEPHLNTQRNVILQKTLKLSENLGRKFALISGDINPIHMHPMIAKLFGFQSTIIHGMYMSAKTLSPFNIDKSSLPVTVNNTFIKPIELPTRVLIKYSINTCSVEPLANPDSSKPFLISEFTGVNLCSMQKDN